MWLLWASMALAVAPDQLPSVDVAEEAELHFQQGSLAYAGGRFEEALEHFLRSHRLAPNRNTAFNIARVYDEMGRPDQAWRYYDVSAQGETNPRMRAPSLQAMSRLEPLIARVQVNSEPPGATVYVGSRELGSRGTAPMTLALMPGRHSIIVQRPGFRAVEIEQVFPGNGLFEVDATLERDDDARRATAFDAAWVASVVVLHGEVIVRAEPQSCEILPDRLGPVAAWREPSERLAAPAPGSVVAAGAPADAALDVTVEDPRSRRTTRVRLSRDPKELWFREADLLRAWALDRCEITDGASVADALEAMPRKLRQSVVAILAELGRDGNIAKAAEECARGDCEALGTSMRF